MENFKPTDVFNIKATPPAELRRMLDYLSQIGSEIVTSNFRPSSSDAFNLLKPKRDIADEQFFALAEMALAGQAATKEQVAQFQADLDGIDAHRLALIARIDKKLEQARAEQQRIYDEAIEVEFPDGTTRKVFRDHDQVRDERGDLVSPDVVKAPEASDDPRQWSQGLASDDTIKNLEAARKRADGEIGDKFQEVRKRADNGEYSANDLDEQKAELENLLTELEHGIDADLPSVEHTERQTKSGLQTDAVPTIDFTRASIGLIPDRAFEEEFSLPNPNASTPAPG